MEPYLHHVQYYETDRMGITHHSNYIRWMEEARVAFLEELGWGYEKLENIKPLLDGRFYPCLKGCYINLEKVTSMSEQSIRFENGEVFNLGRENFIKAKQKYSCYLRKTL